VGGAVAAAGLPGFTLLFLLNALTYLLYICVWVGVVRGDPHPDPVPGGYAPVVRDRAFSHLALVNVAMIAVGWGVFTWLVPPYARNSIGLNSQWIGLLLLANTVTVVVAQVPIARIAEGRRRAVMIAVAATFFVGAFVLVAATGAISRLAYAALIAAAIAVAIGECFHTTGLMPLVADLAPIGLRGRYMAAMDFSWWIGLTVATTLGAQLLSLSPMLTFITAAGVALAAGTGALTLDRRLPARARWTAKS
jgi:predicted MFS family arabinose efflux permease